MITYYKLLDILNRRGMTKKEIKKSRSQRPNYETTFPRNTKK